MSNVKWAIDPAHSEVQFKVKHLMISTVTGNFTQFEGDFEQEGADFSNASINTGNEQRDGHLKAADFFDVENHPNMTFASSTIEKKDDSNYLVHGDLTIRGISKSVVLTVEHTGIAKDPWGNEKAGFNLSGKLNRNDWNLSWNAPLEAGGVLVSEEVRLLAEIQLAKAN
jgi:polyisoprenoid-binding protein YceI